MKFFGKFSKNDRKTSETINALNSKVENYQEQLTKYINKFLHNEEKWKLINQLVKIINSTLELEDLFKLICSKMVKVIGTDICSIYIYEPEEQKLALKYSEVKDNKEKLEYMKKFINEKNIFVNKFINANSDTCSKSIRNYLNENLDKKYNITPIVNNTNFFGVIFLYKENDEILPEEINILQIIAENISMALKNADLYQKLKQNNEHKIEFIAGLSHEFKTPLNTIIGFSEILKFDDTLSKPQINKYMQNILNCSKHLLRLIEDIQDASIAESGKIRICCEKFNSKQVINETLSQLEGLIQKKNLSISSTLMDTIINADIKRFRQIIYNLFSNAIKFSKLNGTIKIITYLSGNKLYFEINNTGRIIEQNEKNKMFQLFYQGDKNKTKNNEGAGIGLALCKKIITLHEGEIDFTSEKDKGTTFWFYLPIQGITNQKLEKAKES